ncbi:arylsulfatase [Pontiella sulfatireligans]|uniref:Arylsulfatase n=1 Tax=Pontiella sulfatireligans TaxID=2750658 RepID=A0A6C2UD08_9BACT|nr:arylsulfatase [Pontiella sulfatireligans]SPS74128.1 sulfatase S1_17 [Kiritimatiellales bacterium]VGO18082.1 Arylsulfatase [Pontiella sulfatireligans]
MKSTLSIVAVLLLGFSVQGKPLKDSRPNIIFVMTDDQGMNLSYMGHYEIQTPHIDTFAQKALRFRNYYVSPNCAPTRAAIMSGVHEFRAAVTATHAECERMALDLTTFPQLLQRSGYETGLFGKWHLGDIDAYLPQNRGFSEVLMHGAGGIGQREEGVEVTSYADFPPNVERRKDCYFDPVLLHNDTIVQTKGYCTDIFFHAALAWMRDLHAKKKPFFAYISTNTPHSPLIAPEENLQRQLDRGMVKSNKRWGMIENIDDNFGVMMARLEEWGMLDNTIVIFTTDNGAPHKGLDPKFKAGHKTGKGTPYEGGVHVPMFWQWKGRLKEDGDIAALTAQVDLYKTFCELTGADVSAVGQQLEGRSLLPLLENPQAEWEPRILQTHRGNLGKDPQKAADKMWSVRTDRWRLVGRELYDLEKDPYEEADVAALHPEVVERLSKSHFEWFDAMLPYMINQNNTWEGDAPMEILYNKQKMEKGIPEWMPEEI